LARKSQIPKNRSTNQQIANLLFGLCVASSLICVTVICRLGQRWNSWTWSWQKTRVFCNMLFTVPSTGGFYRKPYSTLVLKFMRRNPRNKITRVYSSIAFSRTKKRWYKTKQKLKSEKVQVYAPKPFLNMPFKNSISDNDILGLSWMTSLIALVQIEQRSQKYHEVTWPVKP
jgi:hypothetical protein